MKITSTTTNIEDEIEDAIENAENIVVEAAGGNVSLFRALTIEHATHLDPNSAEFDPRDPVQLAELRWLCEQIF